jgi:hypothetical protein
MAKAHSSIRAAARETVGGPARVTHHASRITHHALMNPARKGKIARLPVAVREELNRRLENGQAERTILPWLNALPSVQTVLAAQFGASPVSQQNLSNWRGGGYQDWLKNREHTALVRELADNAEDIAPGSGGPVIARNLSTVLLANLAAHAVRPQDQPPGPEEQFQRLRQFLHTVCEVRREDHRDDRVALQSERQALQQEKWNRIEACQQAGPADSRALEAALAALIESSRSPQNKAKQG